MILDRMRLDGKVALVTGGSQGLGLGMARALAEAGADIALVARDAAKLQVAASEIEQLGRRVLTIPADLTESDAPEEIVARTVEGLDRIDILVTAAALQLRKPILDVTPEEWDRLETVNLRSVYFTCQSAARRMLAQEPVGDAESRGAIITIASLTAVGAWPNVSVYGATKGGVVQMTKAMALEWAPLGIRVNAIGPGTFRTELTEALYADPAQSERIVSRIPAGRPGTPDDLAGAVVFLASPASSYVTGHVLWVDGGWLLMGGGL